MIFKKSRIMTCTAYCTASSYNLNLLFSSLRDQYTVEFYREALHISYDNGKKIKEAFFFPYGVAVFWNWTQEEDIKILNMLAPISTEPKYQMEIDTYKYRYSSTGKIQRDLLILPNTKPLSKLAVSFGLAQSVKLGVFEETIYQTIEKSKQLPQDLAKKGKIFLSRKAISKKIGKLFIDKASVNLHSDILDEPDFFWEHPEYHPLYRDVFKCFDIEPRINVLNHRLTILGDILEILSNQLNHQHSSSLEWTIIWLIVIEVGITLLRDVCHLIR